MPRQPVHLNRPVWPPAIALATSAILVVIAVSGLSVVATGSGLAHSDAPSAHVTSPAPLGQAPSLSVRGALPTGAFGAVAISGTTAWVSQGQWVLTSDMSAPGSGATGKVAVAGRVLGLDVAGNLAAAAGDRGVDLIEGPASAPRVVSHIDGGATDVALSDDLALLTGPTLRVVNVSEPGSPTIVATTTLPAEQIAVQGSLAYVAAVDRGLVILDFSDPSVLRQVGAFTPAVAGSISVSGSTAVVGDHRNGGALVFLDISDPSTPIPVGRFEPPPSSEGDPFQGRSLVDLAAFGTRAYAVWANCGGGYYCRGQPYVVSVDFSVPSAPQPVAQAALGSQPVAVAADEGSVLVSTNALWWYAGLAPCSLSPGALATYDADLAPIGVGGGLLGVTSIRTFDGAVYVGDPERQVTKIDVTDPDRPRIAGGHPAETVGSAYGMGMTRDVVVGPLGSYAARGPAVIVDPGYSGLNGCAPPPNDDWFTRIVPAAEHLYTLDAGGVFHVMRGVWSLSVVGGLPAVAVDGRTGLAVVTGDDGTGVIDVADPAAPRRVGWVDVDASDVSLRGRWAFLAAGSRGLAVVDVVQNDSPRVVAEIATESPAVGIAVSERLAFVAATDRVAVFDVSNPRAPRLLDSVPLSGAFRITAAAPFAYVAASGRIQVLEWTGPIPGAPVEVYLPRAELVRNVGR